MSVSNQAGECKAGASAGGEHLQRRCLQRLCLRHRKPGKSSVACTIPVGDSRRSKLRLYDESWNVAEDGLVVVDGGPGRRRRRRNGRRGEYFLWRFGDADISGKTRDVKP